MHHDKRDCSFIANTWVQDEYKHMKLMEYKSKEQKVYTLFLNAKRNVCTCVPQQILKSQPRLSTPIRVTSCHKFNIKN